MSSELEIVLAVVAVGVALAGLIAAQGASLRREIANIQKETQRELSIIRERLVRIEVMMDLIRTGMQLPHPEVGGDPEANSS